MAAPLAAVRPMSPQWAIRWAAGIAMGTQQRNEAAASMAKTALGGRPRTVPLPAAPAAPGFGSGSLRRRPQEQRGQRHDQGHDEDAEADHALAPAVGGDRALEDRRPQGARHVLPAGDQGQRGAAPRLEPARDVDIERRVDRGVAEEADEQPVPDIELPGLPARREHQARAHHGGPEHDHRRARRTARRASPLPARRRRCRAWRGRAPPRDGAVAPEIGRHVLQGHGRDQGRARQMDAMASAATVTSQPSRLSILLPTAVLPTNNDHYSGPDSTKFA